MNETIKTLCERRSIRRYRPDPIPDDALREIIRCGLLAPSTRGVQARHLLVLTRAADIQRLQKTLIQSSQQPGHDHYKDAVRRPGYSITYGAAPVFMILSSNPAETRCPEADTALVLDNLFHAAWSLGIGSCWINQLGPVGDEPAMRALLRELGMPDDNKVYGAACFGYPDGEAPQPAPRREGIVTIVE